MSLLVVLDLFVLPLFLSGIRSIKNVKLFWTKYGNNTFDHNSNLVSFNLQRTVTFFKLTRRNYRHMKSLFISYFTLPIFQWYIWLIRSYWNNSWIYQLYITSHILHVSFTYKLGLILKASLFVYLSLFIVMPRFM